MMADLAKRKTRPKRGTASERLIAVATRLLIENDGHLEIDQLAAAAECSTGAIYHNYGSKTALLSEVIARYNMVVGRCLVPTAMADSRKEWLASARDAVAATVEFMWNEPLTPVIVQETIKDSGAAAETERGLRTHVATLAAHFSDAQTLKYLPENINPMVLAAGIAGGMRQIIRMFVAQAKPPSIAMVKSETVDFVIRQLDRF